jgi:hypothetical protein
MGCSFEVTRFDDAGKPEPMLRRELIVAPAVSATCRHGASQGATSETSR